MIKKIGKRIRGKKAETVGTTLDMVLGFFVILFLLTIFLIISFLIAEKKIWFGNTNSLVNYEDNLNSQSVLFTLMNSQINYKDKSGKIKDILSGIELNNLDDDSRYQLRESIKNQVLNLTINTTNKCYIFQAVYGINDTQKTSNIDVRGAKYAGNYINKNTITFNSAPGNSEIRGVNYVNTQVNKWLDKGASIILVRNITTNIIGIDTGEKQKIYIKFYSGDCLG